MTAPLFPGIEFVDLAAQRQRLGSRVDDAIKRVVDHGKYIMGPEVGRLEAALRAFCGAEYCVTCGNGTDALALALRAKGVGTGDAVFVPSFTFAATAEVVTWFGATPFFVDVLPDTFNIDPASLLCAIDTVTPLGLKPAAIITVDLFGQPADYEAIATIAAEHDMWILADAAQAFGATYRGRKVGTLGLVSATSFFPAKPLGCYGDGGAVFTANRALAASMDSIRQHGKGDHKYDNARLGVNSRLDTIQASILLEKLAIFQDEIEARQRVAARYEASLSTHVRTPKVPNGVEAVWAQYTIRVSNRDAMAASLKAKGIPTAIYYPLPLHQQAAFRRFPSAASGLTVSERLAGEVLSLPMHPYLDEATQERIVAAVIGAVTEPCRA